MNLSESELERYTGQIAINEISIKGQEKLKKSSVLIVGLGALGSPVSYYLAAAGVGVLGLLDGDKVEKHNLSRQIIHFSCDVSKEKVLSAKEKLSALNSSIKVKVYNEFLNEKNAENIMKYYDFIIDATDNFETKNLIASMCRVLEKPYTSAGVAQFKGQLFSSTPDKYNSWEKIFPQLKKHNVSCAELGIFSPVCAVIGSLQVNEALKYLLGVGQLLTNSLLIYDSLNNKFSTFTM